MSTNSNRFDIAETFKRHVEKRIIEIAKEIPIEKNQMELTSATRLLEKRKEISDAAIDLQQQREEYETKSYGISQRREELITRETQLKEALVKFDKFLKENDAKKERALRKVQEEKKLREVKEKEIEELNQEIKVHSENRTQQLNKIDDLMKYHKFLEVTLEQIPDYGDIKDIIARYETLKKTNDELMERASSTQVDTEKNRELYVSLLQNTQRSILHYNNTLAKEQAKLDQIQIRNSKLKTNLEMIGKMNQERSHLLSQMKMYILIIFITRSIGNLFQMVQSHLNGKIPAYSDPAVQLEEIQQFYLDTRSVVEELQKDVNPI